MNSPVKMKQEEVTGISRSGRVRKKSSKLMDFESPDEIDIRPNRKKESFPLPAGKPGKSVAAGRSSKNDEFMDTTDEESDGFENFQNNDSSFGEEESLSSEIEDINEMNDMDAGDLETEGFQSIAGDSDDDAPSQQQQSVYMMEKSKKKLVIKDGKIVPNRMKAQRKDKGKSRFTAYSLWAREERQDLLKSNPHLDFSKMSKKLGELWATVPNNEKYIWSRRARRIANKNEMENNESKKMFKSPQGIMSPNSKFINKSADRFSDQHVHSAPNKATSISSAAHRKTPSAPTGNKILSAALTDNSMNVMKQVSTNPLDVAAHLKLLAESLTLIGERLTEHEGQIAVSGSFSLMLDSLLCAVIPLLCLTQQVPELNCIPQEQLSKALDNIAYIMPGL